MTYLKLYISDEASKWFIEEMEPEEGDMIRFYARYGGSSPLHEGFSLGVTIDQPMEPSVMLEENGLTFFVEEKDVWYFSGHDLYVDVDPKRNELSYRYEN